MSPVGMIARLSVAEAPAWRVGLAAGQLLAAVLIVCLIARLFRAQTPLSGQPVSLARYLRAVAGR